MSEVSSRALAISHPPALQSLEELERARGEGEAAAQAADAALARLQGELKEQQEAADWLKKEVGRAALRCGLAVSCIDFEAAARAACPWVCPSHRCCCSGPAGGHQPTAVAWCTSCF